ncbi:hypothetical protein HOP50_01g08130 [Chloropicon primus]|nr:hypothetical protein HOP50_01g08130 [Chloropicon primus]
MKYPEPLDKLSVPLAEHLVDDLVHTTESYRNLKLQHNKTVQEFGSAADKLDALTKEHERVVLENNMLHLETIKASESKDDAERRVYQKLKSQEEKIAEFTFWKDQNVEKFQKLERENALLRKQLADIRPGFVGAGLSKKLRDSEGLGAESSSSTPKDEVIADLQQELEAAKSANRELGLQVQDYRTRVENRDLEIKRLSSGPVKKAASLDQIISEEREEETQAKIKGLTRQTEYLTEKLSSYEDLHAAYRSLEEEKYQLVTKIEDVLGENKDLAAKLLVAENRTKADVESDEIAALKLTLSKYEEDLIDLSSNLNNEKQVSKSAQAKLEILKESQKRMEGGFQEKAAAYESAKWRINQLELENKDLLEKTEKVSNENEGLKGKLKDLPVKDATIEHLEKANRDLTEKLTESQSDVRRHLESLKATNEVLSKRSEESNTFVSLKIELESKVTELEKRNQLLAEESSKKEEELRAHKEKSRLRSSDNARMEVVLKNLQSELDSTKTMNSILNDKVSLLSDEKKSQEPLIKKLRIEYNELQESTTAKISQMHVQTMDLTKQNMDLTEKLASAEKSVEVLTKENNELSMEFSHKKSEKSDVEKENSALTSQLRILTVQKDRAEQSLSSLSNDLQMRDVELKALQQEVNHFKDQSAEMRKVLQIKSSDLAKTEEEKTALQEKLVLTKELVEKQKQDLSDAQTRVVSTFSQEEEIKTQVALEQANAVKYKSLYDKTRSELNMLKDQISNVSNMEESFQQELYYAKTQADDRLFEINQLKGLISQLDLTQNKLVGKLKEVMADLEESKRREKEMEKLCKVREEGEKEREGDVGRLQESLRKMDSEKDKLMEDLDKKSESIQTLEQTVETQSMELHSAKLELNTSTIKIRELEQRFKEFKGEYDSILNQCKKLHAGNSELQERERQAVTEIGALSEDMTAMAREQQVVNAELVKAVSERDNLRDEVQLLHKKSLDQERMLEMKIAAIREYTVAYKELGADNESVLARLADLEREIAEKNAMIVQREDEISTMERVVEELEVQNRQAVSDAVSYEAATSELTSALSTAENRMERDMRERMAAQEKVKMSKLNSMQLEAARNAMQNEIFILREQLSSHATKERNVMDENQMLREQLSAQAGKEKNLEGLILELRSTGYKEDGALPAYEEEISSLRADNERLLQLLSNLEEKRVEATSPSSEDDEKPAAAKTPKTPRTKLNEQLAALRSENKRLRSNLQATQETVGRMSTEINRVRDDYEAVTRELNL